MKRRLLGTLVLAVLFSITVWGAAVWVGSQYIETFQNGMLFGNSNILKVSNSVPEFEDASGNVKRMDLIDANIIKIEDFESDIDASDFLCGANLTASNETTAPINGITSIDIDQGGTAASAGIVCDSQPVTLSDKHQGKFVGACFYSTWDGNDNEMAVVINDNTNATELGEVLIRASTEPLEHCVYFNTETNTASVDYDIEVQTGNDNTTLRIDDFQFKVDPLTPTDIYASSEFKNSGPITIEGSTTNPTKGTTATDKMMWRRDGDFLELYWEYRQTSAGSDGSGDYIIRIPSECNCTIDTDFHSASTAGNQYNSVGSGFVSNTATGEANTSNIANINVVDATGLTMETHTSGTTMLAWSSSHFGFNPTTIIAAGHARVKIAGWSDTAQGVVVKNQTSEFDWQSYTPTFTGFGTPSNVSVYYRRVGDSMEVRGGLTLGTVDATGAGINLPSGFAIDSSKISTINGFSPIVGKIARAVTGGLPYNVLYDGGNTLKVSAETSGSFNPMNAAAANNLFATGDEVSFYFTVPIEGWKKSDEVYTVPVDTLTGNYVRAEGNGGESITASTTPIPFTEVVDTANAWDGDEYTVQKNNSKIVIKGAINVTAGVNRRILLYKNGVELRGLSHVENTTIYSFSYASTRGEFAAGDVISIRENGGSTLSSSTTAHYINITEEYGDRGTFLGTFGQPTCYVKDVKGSGTNGGTATSGAYQVHDLNTLEGDCSFASLASNLLTLESGGYNIECSSVFSGVTNNAKIAWRNDSDSVYSFYGITRRSGAADDNIEASLMGRVNISASKNFYLTYQVGTTASTTGLGQAVSYGDEVYAHCKITKVR